MPPQPELIVDNAAAHVRPKGLAWVHEVVERSHPYPQLPAEPNQRFPGLDAAHSTRCALQRR
ncbi:MAG: hypothetical protein SFV23_10850 [Planctomycetaceae bacterium]|nr:hypothetical protein [Planctomycetaceae bacterium]